MPKLPESSPYRNIPSLADFKTSLHAPGVIHPLILKRNQEISSLLAEIPNLPLPPNTPLSLIPNEADQQLLLTPFDQYDGLHVDIPRDHLEGWRVLQEQNLLLATHPARIESMQALEKKGFSAPREIESGIIDHILNSGRIPQLADLGHAKGIIEHQTVGAQTHRTELLATGPFTLIGNTAFSYVGGGAMPDIFGSTLAGTTASKMFVPFGIPEIAQFSDPEKQAALAGSIIDNLSSYDPLLEKHSSATKKYIVSHWKACPTGILEVNTSKALHRAEKLAKAGITSFRIYGHTIGHDVVDTTAALRREYPEAIIYAGQISNPATALACEEAGASAIVVGVGGGGRCTTANLSQLIPTMAVLPWLLRGKLTIPIVGEGGVIDEPIVSALVGMSMVNGSGSIGGGTFESPGGLYFLTKDGTTFLKPYRGEASASTKWLSQRTYSTGLPFVKEGESSLKQLLPYEESMTQKILNIWERIVLGAVILGLDEGPFTIQAMQNLLPSPLFEKTRTAQVIQNPH